MSQEERISLKNNIKIGAVSDFIPSSEIDSKIATITPTNSSMCFSLNASLSDFVTKGYVDLQLKEQEHNSIKFIKDSNE